MMKWTILLVVLFLVGCASTAPTVTVACNEPYINHGTSCCLDYNKNAVCDQDETKEEPIMLEPEVIEEETPEPIPDEPEIIIPETVKDTPAPKISAAKEYYSMMRDKVKMYSFEIKPSGSTQISVVGVKNTIKFISDRTSWWNLGITESNANYIWWNLPADTYYACKTNRYYNRESCVKNHDLILVYEDIKTDKHIKVPEEWLIERFDEEPTKIEKGIVLIDGESHITTDRLYYKNNDKTVTRISVHNTYGVPIKIDIFFNNRLVETIEFDELEINSIKWGPEILEP